MHVRSLLGGLAIGIAAGLAVGLAVGIVGTAAYFLSLDMDSRRAPSEAAPARTVEIPRAASSARAASTWTAPSAARFDPKSATGLRRGEFVLRYQEGYSLDQDAPVAADDPKADLVFTSAAGGVSTVTVAAPAGLATLGKKHAEGSVRASLAVFASVVGVDPASVQLSDTAHADQRSPETEVFVVRTRSGAWAKVAVTGRGEPNGDWTQIPVYFRYVWNPKGTAFAESASADARMIDAIAIDLASVDPEDTSALATLPTGVRTGEFRIHFRQSWSIEGDVLANDDRSDVTFRTCAGGISSVTLAAAGGIVGLERVVGRDFDPLSRSTGMKPIRRSRPDPASSIALLDRIVSFDPKAVSWSTEADGDDRSPASDVFLVRTRHGGWAKLAIVDRDTSTGNWQENPVTIRYAFNAHEPVFEESAPETDVTAGIGLRR